MADKRISQLVERTDIANNDVLPIVASGATTTNKVTISTIQDWMQENLDVGVTSVGLSMPSAFSVSNSPVTTSGNISVSGAGTTAQYIRGDGSLADFPSSTGGGSSVSYYLNGSVNQGTIGGIAYRELSKSPILGAGTDFTINADGYIASFITDAGDPNLLLIPAGNWNFETYLQASSGGGTPTFYIELYKVSGSTATLIASNSASPELIAFGTNINPYFSALAVPETTLLLTDRLAIRYYVTHSGRTITLHTENNTLCQIITTFTTGLTALNGLTAQVQNFATGTSGTDFNISSASTTHTFNIPSASGTARGLITTGSQTIAGEKTFTSALNGTSATFTGAGSTFVSATTTGGSDMRISSGATTGFVGTTSNHPLSFVVNNAVVATIAVGGAATFSSSVNAGQLFLSTPSNLVGNINSTNTNGGALTWQTNGTIIADIGTAQMLFGTGGADTFGINARGSRSLILGTNNTARLTINSAGAATFSGTLNGTSANFSNDITIGSNSGTALQINGNSSDNIGAINFFNNAATTLQSHIFSTPSDLSFATYGNRPILFATNNGVVGGGTRMTISGSGDVTLTGALNGTSASFTGKLSVTQASTDFVAEIVNTQNATPYGLRIKDAASGANGYPLLSVSNNSGSVEYFRVNSGTGASTFTQADAVPVTVVRTTANSNVGIRYQNNTTSWYAGQASDGTFAISYDAANLSAGQFKLTSTGAATFSSSLSARGLVVDGASNANISEFAMTRTDSSWGIFNNTDLRIFNSLSNTTTPTNLRFVITAGGNVGIGTAVGVPPTATLNIKSLNSTNSDSIAQVLTNSELKIQYRADDLSSMFFGGLGSQRGYIQGVNNAENGGADISINPYGGNVGIGTASPSQRLTLNGNALLNASDSKLYFSQINNIERSAIIQTELGGENNHSLLFFTNPSFGLPAERMRITSGGNVLISNGGQTDGALIVGRNGNNNSILAVSDANNTSEAYFRGYSTSVSASRIVIFSNGNIVNTNNSYGALSDIKIKENITDATPKLEDLLKVKVRNYNLIGEETKQIGVIAQELEEVFPSMIDESEDFEEVEVPQLDEEGNEVLNEEGKVVTTKERVSKGTTTKSVKYSVFVPMLIKAIQELKAEIDSLKTK